MAREFFVVPFRSFMRDGRLIYSKVREDMTDLTLAEAGGVLVHEFRNPGHTFRIGTFG